MQAQREYKSRDDMSGKGDPLGIVPAIKLWPDRQIVYAQTQTRISPGKWDAQNSLGIWDKNIATNLGQKIRLLLNELVI